MPGTTDTNKLTKIIPFLLIAIFIAGIGIATLSLFIPIFPLAITMAIFGGSLGLAGTFAILYSKEIGDFFSMLGKALGISKVAAQPVTTNISPDSQPTSNIVVIKANLNGSSSSNTLQISSPTEEDQTMGIGSNASNKSKNLKQSRQDGINNHISTHFNNDVQHDDNADAKNQWNFSRTTTINALAMKFATSNNNTPSTNDSMTAPATISVDSNNI
jgi:hypothetical protein